MKSGRTLPYTINQLLASPRMRIAAETFQTDPMFMKALLTELSLEVFTVTKSSILKRYNTHSDLAQYQLLPYLREINPDDLITFNIYFNLSPMEADLYASDPKFKLSPEERAKLFEKVKKHFMESTS